MTSLICSAVLSVVLLFYNQLITGEEREMVAIL